MIEPLREAGASPFWSSIKIDLVKKKSSFPSWITIKGFILSRRYFPLRCTGEGINILLDEILKVLPASHPIIRKT